MLKQYSGLNPAAEARVLPYLSINGLKLELGNWIIKNTLKCEITNLEKIH